MKRKLFMMLLGLTAMAVQAGETKVTSPDGRLVVTINDNGGQPTYCVNYDGQPMLMPSELGL